MSSELTVAIVAYNRPEYIRTQVLGLRNFLFPCPNIVYLYNGSHEMQGVFSDICRESEVEFVVTPDSCKQTSNPSDNHSRCLDWFVGCGGLTRYVGFLDHDIFLFNRLKMLEILNNHPAYGLRHRQNGFHYFWPGCFFVDSKDTSLSFGIFKGKDTGAGWDWSQVKKDYVYAVSHRYLENSDEKQKNTIEVFDDKWVHFLGASEWNGKISDRKRIIIGKIVETLNYYAVALIDDKIFNVLTGEVIV